MYPNYGDWLSTACDRSGFKPRIVKEADFAIPESNWNASKRVLGTRNDRAEIYL